MFATPILSFVCLLAPSSPSAHAVAPEVRARFEENRRARQIPLYSAPELELDESAESAFAEGEVVRADDGLIMMAFEVGPAERALLLERGTEQVTSKDELRNDVLFEGKWIRVFRAAPSLAEQDLDRLAGKKARITLRQSQSGRHMVVEIRAH